MDISVKDKGLVINLEPHKEALVKRAAGDNGFGEDVLPLEIAVFYGGVGVTSNLGSEQSSITVYPLRLADGRTRPRDESVEPAFHRDAHYLLRIVGPSTKRHVYYQLDKNGRLLTT